MNITLILFAVGILILAGAATRGAVKELPENGENDEYIERKRLTKRKRTAHTKKHQKEQVMETKERLVNFSLDTVKVNVLAVCDADNNYTLKVISYDDLVPLLSESQRKAIIDELELHRKV